MIPLRHFANSDSLGLDVGAAISGRGRHVVHRALLPARHSHAIACKCIEHRDSYWTVLLLPL